MEVDHPMEQIPTLIEDLNSKELRRLLESTYIPLDELERALAFAQ